MIISRKTGPRTASISITSASIRGDAKAAYLNFRKTGGAKNIDIYGDIGDDISAKKVLADLRDMGDVDEISVRINSLGGSAFDGIAIYNLLRQHPARVV